MNCDDCQSRMGDLLDTGQNPCEHVVVGPHMAGCPACRAFLDTWAILDRQLTRHAAKAVLPADFKSTLIAKLPYLSPRLSPIEITERRARFEKEQREALAALERRYVLVDPATLLRLSSITGRFIVAAVLLNALLRTLPEAVGRC